MNASAEWQVFVAQDGTHVADDDYLATLPPQTLLVLLTNEEEMVTGMFTRESQFALYWLTCPCDL